MVAVKKEGEGEQGPGFILFGRRKSPWPSMTESETSPALASLGRREMHAASPIRTLLTLVVAIATGAKSDSLQLTGGMPLVHMTGPHSQIQWRPLIGHP